MLGRGGAPSCTECRRAHPFFCGPPRYIFLFTCRIHEICVLGWGGAPGGGGSAAKMRLQALGGGGGSTQVLKWGSYALGVAGRTHSFAAYARRDYGRLHCHRHRSSFIPGRFFGSIPGCIGSARGWVGCIGVARGWVWASSLSSSSSKFYSRAFFVRISNLECPSWQQFANLDKFLSRVD